MRGGRIGSLCSPLAGQDSPGADAQRAHSPTAASPSDRPRLLHALSHDPQARGAGV